MLALVVFLYLRNQNERIPNLTYDSIIFIANVKRVYNHKVNDIHVDISLYENIYAISLIDENTFCALIFNDNTDN